jgi:Tc toxin complex TcA C-terminal TcB-binding domain/Neuraminidase-like domain/Salmonella virulence plasmid 28.1kDa A protein/Putative peptidoglycan binding domain
MILEISVSQLSLGAKGDDVVRVHRAFEALGRTLPAVETKDHVLGVGTVAVLKALQQELNLPPTGIVDAATVRTINALLAKLTTDPRIVRGSVRDANGKPFTGGFVQIFAQSLGGEHVLGKSPLRDGSYQISYQLTPERNGQIDLRVAVLNDNGLIETTPSGASLLPDAGALEVVNFVLSGEKHLPRAEYDVLLDDLKPLLGTRDLADLTEDSTRRDVSLLASQSGYATDQVVALVLAHKFAKGTIIPAPVFYGMLRQGLPMDAAALHAVHPDERVKALKTSVEQGLVPKEIAGKKIADYLAEWAPAPARELQGLLGRILNANELNTFVGQYLKNSQDPDAFWRQVAADPAWSSRAADLKFTVQLGVLTNNHGPLVAALKALPDVRQPSDLARLTEDQWKSFVQTQGVGMPVETPGATSEEKTRNYVQQILAQVEAAFPTRFFAERLTSSPVSTFLKAQPTYDLRTTYPEQFFKQNPAAAQPLQHSDRQQLRTYQRIHRLTGSTTETLALAAKGVHSAQQIVQMDRTRFAEQHKEIISGERANAIYHRAQRTHAAALALFAEHAADLNRTGLQALPKLDGKKQAASAANSIPDWETLFGTFDLCACQECASVHGPAAYFVDILQFLGDRGARSALFARRPDLGDIELSCENTNTPLPLIDLVNEVLENAVAPPPPFAPLTLAPALEADLALSVATPGLTASFNPPLQTGARVETIVAGKRWRIWDEFFAYSVLKEAAVLTVSARSRQTTGSAAERRAAPQYRNSAAYAELSRSVYPWNLPFDLPREEAAVFLTHLGVSRYDVVEALRPIPEPFDPNVPVVFRLAAERLRFSDVERRILIGESLTPPHVPTDFWDGATVLQLTTVQELLNRSGLSYAELDELVATWFINPTGAVTIAAKPNEPVETCDTTKLQVNGLTAEVLDRIHRFVRLWRKLGWTILEVDRALHALVPDPNTPVLTNEVLVRLDHLRALRSELRLSVAQTLALWKPIDTTEPRSLYRSLFYNPAVFTPQDEVFRLRPDGQELARTDTFLADQSAALQAVFRLNSDGLAFLIGKTDGRMNLSNLSLIYRHATLARQLHLTVQDFVTAIKVTGLDPFGANRSQNALRFVETVQAIRSSGFGFPQLNYLLRHRFNPPASFVPEDSTLTQILAEVRAGLLKVDAPTDADKQKLQESVMIDRVSAAIGLPADVTGKLLTLVTHGGETAQKRFSKLQQIVDPSDPVLEPPPKLSRDNAKPQFETLEKLLKIANVIQTLHLSGSHLKWLFFENDWLMNAPDPPANAIPFTSWFSLIQLAQFRLALNAENAALEAILNAIITVAEAADQPARLAAKNTFVDTLSQWLGWRREDLEALIGKSDDLGDLGLLNAGIPGDYRIDLVTRLTRTMTLLKRLGVMASQASEWCDAIIIDTQVKAIRGAAKAQHDDEAWQKLAVPLQDSLRDKQREALVSYLVARPQLWATTAGNADAHALYSHFLIDVEMSSCQLTSRIKQAMGSVQLFAQRCLMGREAGVVTDDPKWSQWAWMKNFRVWEANRKVWLYPENWIEPDLRDDKTPFFKDLENELLQSDLTDASAEAALRRYLEQLDEVSRLEIVGEYEDDETKNLYVFGRTIHVPHVYYFRRRDGGTKFWMPWEKVDVDIEGDHLIPVVWNRKLMLIWPIFTEKADEIPVTMPPPGHNLKSADRYWDIQLAWSEYQNGRWMGKNLSETVSLKFQGEDGVLFDDRGAASQRMGMLFRPKGGLLPQEAGGDVFGDFDDLVLDPGSNPPPRAHIGLVPKELFCFKGRVEDDRLVVRGFLRRDFRKTPTIGDDRIACCFGEFRFVGCRKIVTTVPSGRINELNFPLAPTGTRFDHMWYTGVVSGLTLFDGLTPFDRMFSAGPPGQVNKFVSIAGDPSPTVNNKQDISVLNFTPTPVRLLSPHQDLQFVCDRPFFFMDVKRTFLVSSTGTSGKRTFPDFGGWVKGDLAVAWRADYFSPPTPTVPEGPILPTDLPSEALQPFTVLMPGPLGRRVVTKLTPVNLTPAFKPKTLIPIFWTTREYRFSNFHHPYLCEFVKTLSRGGIHALLSLPTQSATDEQSFAAYSPKPRVLTPHPIDEVEFQADGAYAGYNWELFFHVPLLIADRLSKNQRFEEAQRWFHFIFDPTGAPGEEPPQRYWHTKPFHERLAGDYEAQSVKVIEEVVAEGLSPEWDTAVAIWRDNPFSPHAIARLRTTAYQKTVVMKYIDNVIAWGDQLFRRETLESINEATQLYVLAAEILGRRPEVIQRNEKPAVQTFNSLSQIGLLGNSLEQIELLVANAGDTDSDIDAPTPPDPPTPRVLYFCVPENDKLLGYWNRVADRLFKIRHCMNIEGQVRQLPLFEPPIDPALLVRARAAGLSIGAVLSEISVSLPNYRFSVMLQKANELVGEVRNLGAALLSALEKRDAEALALLRSTHEINLLREVRQIKEKQIEEAEETKESLKKAREVTSIRLDYYKNIAFMNEYEDAHELQVNLSLGSLAIQLGAEIAAGVLHLIPEAKAGSPTTAGLTYGGSNIASGVQAFGASSGIGASLLSARANLNATLGSYHRRFEEWKLQERLAAKELEQIDRQITAAEIRQAIGEKELQNHDRQIEDAKEVDAYMRGKFTNQDLYQWMVGQVSGLYFQSYQLAYDLAKRTERCMQHELGLKDGETSIIRFGYWDSLKKGLLAGDHLAHDLKRLDIAYLDGNIREYELTKHVSLISLAPEQLLVLKETGICEFEIPEWLFDLDGPGHYMRRIKMVSLTVPCVTGPYTTIHCKAQLMKNSFRRTTNLTPGYNRRPPDDPAGSDDRFVDDRKILEAVVTSTGQNDAGLFEPGMRDERYLPFEGAGAISRWRLELPTEFRTLDYDTISDVILHIRYTARDGGDPLRTAAKASVTSLLGDAAARPLFRLFSLRHEFPGEWHRFVNSTISAMTTMTVDLASVRFPYFTRGRTVTIRQASTVVRWKSGAPPSVMIAPGQAPPDLTQAVWTGQASPGPWTIGTSSDPKLLEDVFVIVAYTVQ